jgi:hypothetical protein
MAKLPHAVLLTKVFLCFSGYGKSGQDGDASLPENYDFTELDAEIERVVNAGAIACLQFEDCLDKHLDYATPELFENVGFQKD